MKTATSPFLDPAALRFEIGPPLTHMGRKGMTLVQRLPNGGAAQAALLFPVYTRGFDPEDHVRARLLAHAGELLAELESIVESSETAGIARPSARALIRRVRGEGEHHG